MSVNKVILVGNVGKNPEIKYVGNRPYATFSLATSDPAYTNAQGVTVPERTEWHNIVMWDAAAEFAEKYIRKGSRLLLEGKIRTRYWEDRNAIKHSTTSVYVDSFELLPRGGQ